MFNCSCVRLDEVSSVPPYVMQMHVCLLLPVSYYTILFRDNILVLLH